MVVVTARCRSLIDGVVVVAVRSRCRRLIAGAAAGAVSRCRCRSWSGARSVGDRAGSTGWSTHCTFSNGTATWCSPIPRNPPTPTTTASILPSRSTISSLMSPIFSLFGIVDIEAVELRRAPFAGLHLDTAAAAFASLLRAACWRGVDRPGGGSAPPPATRSAPRPSGPAPSVVFIVLSSCRNRLLLERQQRQPRDWFSLQSRDSSVARGCAADRRSPRRLRHAAYSPAAIDGGASVLAGPTHSADHRGRHRRL